MEDFRPRLPEYQGSVEFQDLRTRVTNDLLPLHSTEAADTLARLFIGHASGEDWLGLITRRPSFGPDVVAKVGEMVQRALGHEPWQYILGEVDFAGLQLKVCPAVLIPRPETEEMACMARDILRERTTWLPAPRILDAATGSGCLALAMKRWFPGAKVTGTDLSEEALTLAGENALRNGLDVKFVHADLLRPPPPGVQGNLHLILSNPPYVRWEEHQLMQPNVLEWEPHSALFAPDEDPLAFYRSLALWGKQLLVPGGMVLAELNEALGDETASIFTAAGYLNVGLARDFRGRIRFLKASLLCG